MLFVKSKPGAARLGSPRQRVASRPATRLATIHRRGASPAHVGRRRRRNGVVCAMWGEFLCWRTGRRRFWLGCGLDCQGCATAPGAASVPGHVTWSCPSLGGRGS